VGPEEVPDDRGGVEVVADAAGQHPGQVLGAAGPAVAAPVEAYQDDLAVAPPARIDRPQPAAALDAGVGGVWLPHRIARAVQRGLLGVDRLLRPEPRPRRVGDAAHHRGDGRDARRQVCGQVVREDGAVRDAGGVEPPRIHRVRAADRVDQRAHEADVVDVIAMGARARELPAVVPVLPDALREGAEEALAVGQRREAGEALGAGAVAAAAVEDQHQGRRRRGKGEREPAHR
jgi:hypothetical protein